MTNSETESGAPADDATVQPIPAVIRVSQSPAAADARDRLLAAIGAEAQTLAEKSPGHASTALEALARAYAIVTTSTAAATAASGVVTPTGRSADQISYNIDTGEFSGNAHFDPNSTDQTSEYDVGKDDLIGNALVNVDDYHR
ncbi:hypothetical protein [Streptomyces virginiae]|uniref:hypothetical protein n=1 Tax=Streptomyces virginiae TaxID=1961 RepID=UPI0036901A20